MKYFIFIFEDSDGFRSVSVEKVKKGQDIKPLIDTYEGYINIYSIISAPDTKRDAEEMANDFIKKYKAKGIYKEL